jgi:hypothetical protein
MQMKNRKRKKTLNIDVMRDKKRQGFFVNGDGFDFFAYFTGTKKATNIECDHVERAGFGNGYSIHLIIENIRESINESELKSKIIHELYEHSDFFLENISAENPQKKWRDHPKILSLFTQSIVKILVLDMDGQKISYATGFLVKETDDVYLYTCWHVLTGFDFFNVQVTNKHWPPQRRKIAISFPSLTQSENALSSGGKKELEIELYEEKNGKFKPLWKQERDHRRSPDLNAVGIKVPRYYDFIKIPIGRLLDETERELLPYSKHIIKQSNLDIGKSLIIAGYPYGFSVFGDRSPKPVFLSRTIASDIYFPTKEIYGLNILLDGAGFAGMSGCPVFSFDEESVSLVGIYTGCIFPDAESIESKKKNDRMAALGLVSLLDICLEVIEE